MNEDQHYLGKLPRGSHMGHFSWYLALQSSQIPAEKLPSDPWVVLLLFLIAGHLPPTSHTGNLKLPTRLVLFLLATLQVHRSQLIMHHSSQIGCAGTNPTILPLGMAFGHTIVGPSASEKLSTPLRCYAYWYDLA